jgi:hypothetical protein
VYLEERDARRLCPRTSWYGSAPEKTSKAEAITETSFAPDETASVFCSQLTVVSVVGID